MVTITHEATSFPGAATYYETDHLTLEGVGGGVLVISEKNILQTDFEGKKILQGNTRGTKFLHWKDIFHSV